MRTRMRRRAATIAVLVVALATLVPGGTFDPRSATAAPEFTNTKTITRTHRNADGTDNVVDTRTFSVSVNQQKQLKAQQQILVQWTGAHPSLGIGTNPWGQDAYLQEYPVVLMECRGTDTATDPVDPRGCWTQFEDERRNETSSTSYPAWRLDRYATAGDLQAQVGYPSPLPDGCVPANTGLASRHVPFVAADQDHTTYWPIALQPACGPSHAPEAEDVEDPDAPPANTTFAVTNADGTGSAKFVVWTDAENASLGCSTTVACSLVVIPIMGMSCDLGVSGSTDADRTACKASGKNAPDTVVSPLASYTVDEAVTGEYWWSAANWKNRVTMPLGFGAPSNVCDADNRAPTDVFGSELMSQATTQWAPAFCLDPNGFKFRHVRVGEPQAKSAVDSGDAEAALISVPPLAGYEHPTVNAPVAVTGFAISYVADKIDPTTGQSSPYHDLKLNARLLAKLLAESYVPNLALRDEYAGLPASNPYSAMAHNPLDLSTDKEFIALNPGVGNHSGDAATSATLLAISSNSDVMYALTGYINADPEARAWLDGTPDPSGMVVNPGYKGITLPVQAWPLSDAYVPTAFNPYGGDCVTDPQLLASITPVPYLPLVASPVPSLAIVAQRLQFAISNAHTKCQVVYSATDGSQQVGAQLVALGRQGPGHRLMLGITSLADAQFGEIDTAALQSNAPGTFVAPTEDSLKAAMALARPDATLNAWVMPYDALRGTQGAQAYPGTMPVYVSVPTTGLPAEDAARMAQFVRFAAGAGQTPGEGNGQLPPGYLPMTAANGQSALVAYALIAAAAISAQTGQVPSVSGATPTPTPTDPGQTGGTNPGTGTGAGAAATTGVPNPGAPVVVLTPTASPKTPSPVLQSAGLTTQLFSTLGRWALPTILIVGLAAFGTGLGTRVSVGVANWRRGRRRDGGAS